MKQFKFIHSYKSRLLLVLLSVAALFTVQGFGGSAFLLFRYETTLVQTGEWWRLLSGHFIHLSWMHLILNIVGLCILTFIFHQILKPIILLISILLLALGTSIGLLVFSPDVSWYVGLSGVLHGLIVIGSITYLQSNPRIALILLVGITIKLLWEQYFADAYAMQYFIGGKVIYDAHLYGAVSGAIITGILIIKNIPPKKF